MADRFIQYAVSDRIATITLDRPEKRNAFSENMRRQLIDTWLTFKEDDEADVAILTGSGEASWSAGSDLREIANGLQIEDPDWRSPVEGAGTVQLATMTGLNITKPVIAVINGYALGFAFGLALACDIRICSPNALFASSEVKYGHMAGGGPAVPPGFPPLPTAGPRPAARPGHRCAVRPGQARPPRPALFPHPNARYARN